MMLEMGAAAGRASRFKPRTQVGMNQAREISLNPQEEKYFYSKQCLASIRSLVGLEVVDSQDIV
jgi:hypothetical protein